jgi:3-hydroxyacyl-[acyl-carrier-protein] dehydratase
MRLDLVDRIAELHPGRTIRATKSLTISEEYLQDHFPRFPVMPGVMMLEAMYQTAAWLVRATDDFRHSMVALAQANNLKFSDFVEPGQTLELTADVVGHDERTTKLKCQGTVEDRVAVRGRLVLERYCLAETNASNAITDAYITDRLQKKLKLLYPAWMSETNG